MGHRLLYAAALVAVLALGVSGCSGDPEPKFADPTSDPPTSTGVEPVSDPPTPTPTATQEPKPESAQAFIRRYAKAEAKMQNSGQTTEYLTLARDCTSCEELADNISGYYAAGGDVRWGGWKILGISRYEGSDGAFAVKVSSAPTTYRVSEKAPEQRLDGGRVTYILTLARSGTTWVLTDTSRLAS